MTLIIDTVAEYKDFFSRIPNSIVIAEDMGITKEEDSFYIVQKYSDDSYISCLVKQVDGLRYLTFEVGSHISKLTKGVYTLTLSEKNCTLCVFNRGNSWLTKFLIHEELSKQGIKINF